MENIESLPFKALGDNMFLLEFKHYWDKSKVLEGRPWIFEGQLFSLAEFDGLTPPHQMNFDTEAFWIRMYDLPLACLGKDLGFKLGCTVGIVEEVDTNEEGVGWREYLRVRIQVSVVQPPPRERMLKLKDRSMWIPFQYEKIPKFYFSCGVIHHGAAGCLKGNVHGKYGSDITNEYDPWLRVSSTKFWSEKNRIRGAVNNHAFGLGSNFMRDRFRPAEMQKQTMNVNQSMEYHIWRSSSSTFVRYTYPITLLKHPRLNEK